MALIKFAVEGRGPFPFDMLRYDACWPASQEDAAMLELMDRERHRRDPATTHTLTLATNAHVTEARWQSFGWKVVTA